LQARYWDLVSGHAHTVNAAANGLSVLPGTARPYAAVRAMSRFLRNDAVTLPAVIEPAQDAVRAALAERPGRVALVVHDWCMFAFHTHTAKRDRSERTGPNDCGYELASALLVDGTDGRPLGPTEFRLRTAAGTLSTRPRPAAGPPGHVDELLDGMAESRRWGLDAELVHVVDREADSVGHSRRWQAGGHRFVVRAKADRVVMHEGVERSLTQVVGRLGCEFQPARQADGSPRVVAVGRGTGVLKVAEAAVVLHRPAERRTGDGGRVEVPGPPLPLRLVATRVVSAVGVVLAEWLLLTNVPAGRADAATAGTWYAWRWRIETYHTLLKSAGVNAEEWGQETGERFLRRVCVASMACLTAWQLQREEGPQAARLRAVLVRLSGRAMKHRVESTAPALLAGLEKLLAVDALLRDEDLAEVLALARQLLPHLFNRQRKPPVEKL
jgi:hypothetical protein